MRDVERAEIGVEVKVAAGGELVHGAGIYRELGSSEVAAFRRRRVQLTQRVGQARQISV